MDIYLLSLYAAVKIVLVAQSWYLFLVKCYNILWTKKRNIRSQHVEAGQLYKVWLTLV